MRFLRRGPTPHQHGGKSFVIDSSNILGQGAGVALALVQKREPQQLPAPHWGDLCGEKACDGGRTREITQWGRYGEDHAVRGGVCGGDPQHTACGEVREKQPDHPPLTFHPATYLWLGGGGGGEGRGRQQGHGAIGDGRKY